MIDVEELKTTMEADGDNRDLRLAGEKVRYSQGKRPKKGGHRSVNQEWMPISGLGETLD